VKIQSIFNALNGTPYSNSNYVISGLIQFKNFNAIHLSLINYALTIPLHILRGPVILFIVQWGGIAAAGLILYSLALELGLNDKMAFLVFLISIIYVPTIMSGMYDMHYLSLFPLATLIIYYSFKKEKWVFAAVGVIFGFSLQESFMLLLPFIMGQVIIDRHGLKNATKIWKWKEKDYIFAMVAVFSIIIFFLELKYMQSLAPQRSFLITSSAGYGISFSNLFMFFKEKLLYLLIVFALLLFLPVISPEKLVIAVPGLLLILFSNHASFAQLQFQYSFILSGGILLAFITSLRKLQYIKEQSQALVISIKRKRAWHKLIRLVRKKHPLFLSSIIIIVLSLNIIFSPLSPLSSSLPNSRPIAIITPPEDINTLNNILGLVPSNASILASDFIFPHLATDPNSYPILHAVVNGSYVVSDKLPSNYTPEYIFIFPSDFSSAEQIVTVFPHSYGLLADGTLNFSQISGIRLVSVKDSLLLYKFNYLGTPTFFSPLNTFLQPQDFTINYGVFVKDANISNPQLLRVEYN
ncbi:conserved hypothetical protein, membrane, partial [mine drainage metagenome]